MSSSHFNKWLFGAENVSELSRNARKDRAFTMFLFINAQDALGITDPIQDVCRNHPNN